MAALAGGQQFTIDPPGDAQGIGHVAGFVAEPVDPSGELLDLRRHRLLAKAYGMVHGASSSTAAVRAVFFIDPKRRIRAMIYYPLNVGRNFDEIVRVIDALQTADEHAVACPADWRPGEDVIVPPPSTTMAGEERVRDPNLKVTDWYFSKRSL